LDASTAYAAALMKTFCLVYSPGRESVGSRYMIVLERSAICPKNLSSTREEKGGGTKVHYMILAVALIAPVSVVAADRPPEKSDADRSRYSDRDVEKKL
jgi:hypothetical protein